MEGAFQAEGEPCRGLAIHGRQCPQGGSVRCAVWEEVRKKGGQDQEEGWAGLDQKAAEPQAT